MTKEKDDVASGGGGGDDGKIVVGINLHCEGCAMKITKAVKKVAGVEKVAADIAGKRLTVTGSADPWAIKETIERKAKMKKEVKFISPANPPKPASDQPAAPKGADHDAGAGKQPPASVAADGKKPKDEDKPKEASKEVTVALKIPLHCADCQKKIVHRTSKMKGVKKVVANAEKDLVVVTGTFDAIALRDKLKENISRSVEIVGASSGGEKKKEADAPPKKVDGDEKPKAAAEAPKETKDKALPPTSAPAGQRQHYSNYSGQQLSTGFFYAEPQGYRVEHGGDYAGPAQQHQPGGGSFYAHPYSYSGGQQASTSYYAPSYAYHGEQSAPAARFPHAGGFSYPVEMALSDENPHACTMM